LHTTSLLESLHFPVSARTQPLELAWARFIFNSHVHGAPFCDQGPHAPYVHGSGDHYQCQLGAGVSDDNLSEKMHGGGVAGHGHGLNALNHDVPPEFDPQCSDDAPSGSPESLLLGHDPLKKHVAFSQPPWEANMGILDLGCLKEVHHLPQGLKIPWLLLSPYKPVHHAPEAQPFCQLNGLQDQ